jgi:high-affinity nickel-transport protein
MEFGVALALVVVGLLNLGRLRDRPSELEGAPGRPPAARAFVVGLVHGLAGSAAVALLVLATVRDPLWACGYLLVFALGTLAGMALISTGFAVPAAAVARRGTRVGGVIRMATGALSLGFGIWLAWRIGWHDGLFLATPLWTPH